MEEGARKDPAERIGSPVTLPSLPEPWLLRDHRKNRPRHQFECPIAEGWSPPASPLHGLSPRERVTMRKNPCNPGEGSLTLTRTRPPGMDSSSTSALPLHGPAPVLAATVA